MDFELRAAKEKWEREQRQKKEQARARIEREKKAREEALRQREALEAAQRQRRLEEADASLAAMQQDEEDLIVGDGVKFKKVLEATPVGGDGDKIRLPPSAFAELSSQGALDKGPMYFALFAISVDSSNAGVNALDVKEQRRTHAGVLQFTAQEGHVELPSHVWQNLFGSTGLVEQSPLVHVRYVRLPRGNYAKLQPEVPDFADISNHKAVLETKLRQHATLSEDDLLTVQYGGVDYGLRVLELKPSSAVSVIETDMEVDVVESVSVSGAGSQRVLVPLILGKPQVGVVDEGDYQHYKFSLDQSLVDASMKGDINLIVRLDVDGGGVDSDADLYVAIHPVLFPTQHQHQWSSHDIGTKLVCLNESGKTLNAGMYSIGVYGFRGRTNFRIVVEVQPSRQDKAQGHRVGVATVQAQGSPPESTESSANAEQAQAGFGQCRNCMQYVPIRTLTLHEAYCRRHNVVCQYPGCGIVLRLQEMEKHVHCTKCGQAFRQEELSKHMKVYHEPRSCGCGVVLEKEEMVNHQATSCPLRMITCRFCGDVVEAGGKVEDIRDSMWGLTQHESNCGARTSPCDSCGRAVMLKEMELHRAAAHGGTNQQQGVVHGGSVFVSPPASTSSVRNEVDQHIGALADQDEGISAHQGVGMIAEYVECPICGLKFGGLNFESQLNIHLDNEHFLTAKLPVSSSNLKSTTEGFYGLDSSSRRSLSVSCPICGIAVHSERDLSYHIDMVH